MISWCEECIHNGKAGAKGPLEILKKEREYRAELMESNRKQAEKEKKEREKEAKRSGKKEKQNAKQESEEGSEKPEMPAVPPKTEGPSKPAEPEYKHYVKPGVKSAMDSQPGVPNKFTEDAPIGWNVPGLGVIPTISEEKKIADVNDTDSVLDFLTPGYKPQVPENPAEGYAAPVGNLSEGSKEETKEETKKGGFWSRWIERRS